MNITVSRPYCFYALTFSQDSYTVTYRQHFLKLMRNDYDRAAFIFHSPKDSEQSVRLLRCKYRCRFIKYEYLRALVQYFQDLYCLFLTDTHIIYIFIGVYLKSVFFTYFCNFCACCPIAELFSLSAHVDIISSTKSINKLKMLMDHSYSKFCSIDR